jgi:D-alanyl-D-alanine-carboxypeptidase/D-alanyl-D-alanine-endopeptidase
MRYPWRMGFLFVRWLFCSVVLFASMSIADARKPAAADAPLLAAPFRKAVEQGVGNDAYASLAIGLIDGKRQGTFYFGHRDGPDSKPADDDSQFEIGAISEVFTGLLLAQAALERRVKFSDPIEAYLPAPFPFADARLGKITLAQLATQCSGLPAQPANLFPADLDDPYADYASEDLLALLAFQPANPQADDQRCRYSVLNAGLLGHLLGRVYGMPFEDALATEILAPLGLQKTTFADAQTLMPGHAYGEHMPHWHYGVLAGAAGLRASLPDLLKFLQTNLTPEASSLRAALLLARQAQTSGIADQPGLGWNVRDAGADGAPWPLVWRASRTGGFASFIGFRTDKQKAIVILGNNTEDVAALGMAWLDEISPPPPPSGSAAAKLNKLDEYPGLYRISYDVLPVVRVEGNLLSLHMPGEFPLRLHAADHDVFISDGGARAVTFIRNIDEITGFVLHAGDSNVSAERLSTGAPRLPHTPISVTANMRNGVLGDYRIDDDHWMRIAAAADGLSVQWTMSGRRSMFAYAPDRYTDADGAVDLNFKRDSDGRVTSALLDLAGARRAALPLRRNLTAKP